MFLSVEEGGNPMPIKIVNYAGRFGWNMRKYLPKLASVGYLNLQYITEGAGRKNTLTGL